MPASATKILIIDDDADLVSLLTDNLQLEGFSPSPAYNGEDGLLKLSQENFDLVILDVMMPGMKGTEVLAKIREHSHIPVIMLTARGDPADRIIGLELGADDYVPKPFTPRELVARIRAILRRTASQESPVTPLVVGPLTVNPAQRRVWVTATKKNIELTSTEFSLFEMLGRNKSALRKSQPLASILRAKGRAPLRGVLMRHQRSTSSIRKASMMSPSLMSWNFSKVMPHS